MPRIDDEILQAIGFYKYGKQRSHYIGNLTIANDSVNSCWIRISSITFRVLCGNDVDLFHYLRVETQVIGLFRAVLD